LQRPFSCTPDTYANVAGALSAARLNRFLPAANQDHHFALRLYVWNARLCQAFYLPQQLLEVSLRNALQLVIANRYGVDWHVNTGFRSAMSYQARGELDEAVTKERLKRGAGFAIDHVIARLSFGFWVSLLAKGFEHQFWSHGMADVFPNAPRALTRGDISIHVDRIRRWRNRLAHQHIIFDKAPARQYQGVITLIGWMSADMAWLAKELSRVSTVINARPRL
jgi:hypothetical protein